MIKHILSALVVALVVGGVTLVPELEADAAGQPDCSGYPGLNSRAGKVQGADPAYPASCYISSCRLLGYTRTITKVTQECNPVTGCHPVSYTAAKYAIQSGTASTPCPADVTAGTWVKP